MDRIVCSCISLLFVCSIAIGQINPATSCSYTLEIYDAAANGWDGAYLEISINNGPVTNYTINTSQGSFASYNLAAPNGSLIDINYVGGANEDEHTYIIKDAMGVQIFSDGPYPDWGSIPTLKVECPDNCIVEEEFLLLITTGANAEQMSWELRDNSGQRVVFANANSYAGFPAGIELSIPLNLETCEEYEFVTFDGSNDGWNGGSFQIISANANRGSLISSGEYSGNFEILSGPDAFIDEANFYFTLPCIECPVEQVALAPGASNNDCVLDGYSFPFNELPTPLICYPNTNHGVPSPSMNISYPTAIPAVLNVSVGTVVNLPVGDNDVVFEVEYNDGQFIRCTTTVKVITETNPILVCNDNLIVPLNDISSNSDCEMMLTPDMVLEATSSCENQFLVTIFDSNGNDLGNIINPSMVGLTLDYRVAHIVSNSSCEGTITVQDKTAPHINCKDYTIACNHPNLLDEYYSYSMSFLPNENNLPANIAGGAVAPSPPSITVLKLDVPCGPLGEVLQNLVVNLEIEHTEVGDLQIDLITPNGVSRRLMNGGTCSQGGAPNMLVSFNSMGDFESINTACNINTNPVVNGTYKPVDNISFDGVPYSDLEGEWELIITDNNNTVFLDPVVGVGQVLAASIEIQAGFLEPASADDCSNATVEMISEIINDTDCVIPWIGAEVVRLWRATDGVGNMSTCEQIVSLQIPSLANLELPEDIILECDEIPELELTGIPTFDCFDVSTNQNVVCDLTYTYEDEVIASCGIGIKIF